MWNRPEPQFQQTAISRCSGELSILYLELPDRCVPKINEKHCASLPVLKLHREPPLVVAYPSQLLTMERRRQLARTTHCTHQTGTSKQVQLAQVYAVTGARIRYRHTFVGCHCLALPQLQCHQGWPQ